MSNDIIRMAQDACSPYQVLNTDPEFLTRFAALVAANERERCALVCITLGEYYAECDDFEAEDVAHACASSIRGSEK